MLDNIARRAMQSHVKASLKKIPKAVTKAPEPVIKAPLVKEVTGGDLAKKAYVELTLSNIGRPNLVHVHPVKVLGHKELQKQKVLEVL